LEVRREEGLKKKIAEAPELPIKVKYYRIGGANRAARVRAPGFL
jgi:hypothetical protein